MTDLASAWGSRYWAAATGYSRSMIVGAVRELAPGELRTALVPESVGRLREAGAEVVAEAGLGEAALFGDSLYEQAGATLRKSHREPFAEADLLVKVQAPLARGRVNNELALLRQGTVLVGMLQPLSQPELAQGLARRGVTAFSLDRLPRISRAQDMDVLSAMSTVSGYHAVLMAAERLPRFFPLLMTAAGTVTPARVLVLGAGVAGLQAIATARRLGALVRAFDVRPAVREQVESLGAQFVEVAEPLEGGEGQGGYAAEVSGEAQAREQATLAHEVSEADVVISTALVPGRPAPILVSREAVESMRPGSVVVDVAAEAGGNCEVTKPGEDVRLSGVLVMGPLNLPSRMPYHASQLYSRSLTRFVLSLIKDGHLELNFEDPVVADTCVCHDGELGRAAQP